jgi:hypothetical protein
MKLLANRLSQQAGKSLVIAMTGVCAIARSRSLVAMTGHSGFPEFAGFTCQFFNFPLPHSEKCVTVIKYENLNNFHPRG